MTPKHHKKQSPDASGPDQAHRQPATATSTAYERLRVLDRLEIGPVKLERRRLSAPYRVIGNGRDETTELLYSYEEDVFEPAEASSRNLANMIAAQVAINYGLFCKEICFHGAFDQADQELIREMTENTACEIYVKKFLEPNPFLTGEAKSLQPQIRDRYSQAELIFTDQSNSASASWATDSDQHAILSSGGKDSLLSFGLINELGYPVHALFGNESGRHWFTALNAYRHFKSNIPGTGRVWMTTDRVFNWMLRRLPFIRQDFADLRSDQYPIRLWTVAVFLFGVLPLLRKRGIGRLLIGDEYDSTWKTSTHGITHYDGLFDQSIYFDRALTAYFSKKRWDIHQFSMLRQLSEMLILKVLVNRYPELQRQQVSCHATHQQEERIHPCGKCEKCRRIVGMLTAFGADPTRCGYSGRQIIDCLRDLAQKGIHQEAEGASHLIWLLSQQSLIDLPEAPGQLQAQPQIMNLRFHPERSPLNTIPEDLRAKLYPLLLQYADGALTFVDEQWLPFDPMRAEINDQKLNEDHHEK